MPNTYKTLAQSAPSATTLTTIYTTPASTQTITSALIVANRSTIATSFRSAIAIAGAADTLAQYLHYDAPIGANESIALVLGLSLQPTDQIRVYATLATLSFNIFGVEKT